LWIRNFFILFLQESVTVPCPDSNEPNQRPHSLRSIRKCRWVCYVGIERLIGLSMSGCLSRFIEGWKPTWQGSLMSYNGSCGHFVRMLCWAIVWTKATFEIYCCATVIQAYINAMIIYTIWGSHGCEYKDGCLLYYSAVWTDINLPTLQFRRKPYSIIYMTWREEHFWSISALQKVHSSSLVIFSCHLQFFQVFYDCPNTSFTHFSYNSFLLHILPISPMLLKCFSFWYKL
jgi:hypothetical protein